MTIAQIINVMLPVLIVISFGYLLSKIKKQCDVQILSDLIIYITTPCLFISSLSSHDFSKNEILVLILAACAVIVGALFIMQVFKKYLKLALGIQLPIAFMNSGFIGFPIILMLYGQQGLAYAIIYDAANALLLFSLGIYVISGRQNKWEVLRIPILYAGIAGILLNIFNIEIPAFIFGPISMVGNITIPLALILLGFRLGCIRIGTMLLPVFYSALRFSFGLVIALIIIKGLNITGLLANVIIIMSILPSALTCIVLSEKYRKEDSDAVASTILISTLFSIIYIPIVLMFLGGIK